MKELAKGLLLFLLNWLLVLAFYYLQVLSFVGDLLKLVLKTSRTPDVAIIVDIFLIIVISYFINYKFVKAKLLVFVFIQGLFALSALALFLMAVQSVAHGIMGA